MPATLDLQRPSPPWDRAHWLVRASRAVAWFTLPDLVVLGHIAGMWGLLWASGEGGAVAAKRLQACGMVLAVACLVGRSRWLPAAPRAAVYRLSLVGALTATYLFLRESLPLVQPDARDALLDAIDVRLVGLRPTVWLEPLMTPAVVEYLAFFYLSYFGLCALFALLTLGPRARPESSAEFTIGTSLVFGIGQLGYVLVPAFGPFKHLAAAYRGPLVGGPVWETLLATVEEAGALKDVFPSLHNAASVWFAIFAARRALRTRAKGWTIVAVGTAFFAVHIAASTIALRWHYLADALAGWVLGGAVAVAAPHLARAERQVRARLGLPPAWE
jgi:membrane-associated phospholipid phosphatase